MADGDGFGRGSAAGALPRTVRRRATRAGRADQEFAVDPGPQTLQRRVDAWDSVLTARGFDEADVVAQEMLFHRAAAAHLQVVKYYGAERHAEIAMRLLERLRDARSSEIRIAARADLAALRLIYYDQRGDEGDLRDAADLYERALREAPEGFPYRAIMLANLGDALAALGQLHPASQDLDTAVERQQEAVDGAGDQLSRPLLLVKLAVSLIARYQRDGVDRDLADAARLLDEAEAAGAREDPQAAIGIGQVLWERHVATGDPALLDRVIDVLAGPVRDLPPDGGDWATAAANQANALLARHVRTAARADLTLAGEMVRQALAALGPTSPDAPRLHHVLGLVRWHEYQRTGELGWLQDAVGEWQIAVTDLPANHLARPGYLNSVAVGLLQRFGHYGDERDLRAAVARLREALEEVRPGAPVAATLWNNLGHALADRYRRFDDDADLDAAVTGWERAVQLTPPGSLDRADYMASLGNGLRERAARSQDSRSKQDLTRAVALQEHAVAALGDRSRELAGQLVNLGLSLHGLAAEGMHPPAYGQAEDAFRRAVDIGQRVSPGEALRAAIAWEAMAAAAADWPTAAAAAEHGLRAIRVLFAAQLLRHDKESWLRSAGSLSTAAAWDWAAANNAVAAVAAMENGRVLLFDDALQRSQLDLTALRSRGRGELADRYAEAAQALQVLTRMSAANGRWAPA